MRRTNNHKQQNNCKFFKKSFNARACAINIRNHTQQETERDDHTHTQMAKEGPNSCKIERITLSRVLTTSSYNRVRFHDTRSLILHHILSRC